MARSTERLTHDWADLTGESLTGAITTAVRKNQAASLLVKAHVFWRSSTLAVKKAGAAISQ